MRASAAVLASLVLAGCGGGEPRLVVSAAASMADPLRACSRDFPGAAVRLSFGGSDELAAQVRQGVRPDVYAAANTSLPEQLQREGLLGETVEFATNELVLALPRGSGIGSLRDLARRGTTIAVGSESVPVGAYTRELLARLPGGQGEAILANVRSNEPDVRGIVGKLTQGAADAGFVYRTEVGAAAESLRLLRLPAELQPTVVYAAGVVSGAERPREARAYLRGLARGECASALRDAGFGRPPS